MSVTPSWSSGTSAVIKYTFTDNTTGTMPMQMYPAMVALPTEAVPEKDDSPLGWLRGQVSEICELARAA